MPARGLSILAYMDLPFCARVSVFKKWLDCVSIFGFTINRCPDEVRALRLLNECEDSSLLGPYTDTGFAEEGLTVFSSLVLFASVLTLRCFVLLFVLKQVPHNSHVLIGNRHCSFIKAFGFV